MLSWLKIDLSPVRNWPPRERERPRTSETNEPKKKRKRKREEKEGKKERALLHPRIFCAWNRAASETKRNETGRDGTGRETTATGRDFRVSWWNHGRRGEMIRSTGIDCSLNMIGDEWQWVPTRDRRWPSWWEKWSSSGAKRSSRCSWSPIFTTARPRAGGTTGFWRISVSLHGHFSPRLSVCLSV